ncbi:MULTISPECIES: DUF2865 domain-containing protein [Rhodopseudomonas]|uniref:DUF2865 domain-containing protein n=1 Tax=Rhodopseudomonas palustris TaxID=1076 RepID=A0A0D7EWD0_RHOPL|nr:MULTISPECIES: DUF2865 domain-containing protein [Rhodopseudomonas]KIZ44946.1 hypothetical protein OO17_08855 [Rhodopseudomonas palustris]MDF3812245.1 DUF2865 domain-containing protein [Rhodopseudomonas sp. BAL398]WOK15419.1 DUF2865 domain-containing protein [Rhodopseudomonas sp. BAL398]
MSSSSRIGWCAAAAVLLVAGASQSAHAEDFFSALFGGLVAPQHDYAPSPMRPMSYGGESDISPDRPGSDRAVSTPRRSYSGGTQAYCVRSCDGRYFPLAATGGQSKAETCNSFCPASETNVIYGGGTIDNAVTKSGKRYSELPNAFKYRSEIVAGCTCNGKNQFGLAKIKIEDDPTVRKGDLVAEHDGLMVAQGSTRDDRELKLSRASAAVRSRYQHIPVMASD